MNWILKNKKSPCRIAKNKNISQGKKIKALFAVLFLVFVFSFFVTSGVKAADTPASTPGDQVKKAGTCVYWKNGSVTTQVDNDAECQAICVKEKTTGCAYHDNSKADTNPAANKTLKGAESDNIFTEAIKKMLIGVLNFCGWLFAVASTIFAYTIEPTSMSGETGILNATAVRDVWIMVRDLLNMAFILVLLFSAFGTIFQLDKWNIKKVWLNILINALLVNFSFPIARFIIDVSNVTFYYFVNNLFSSTGTVTGSTIFASFGASSHISELLSPSGYANFPIAYLITMIIVTFLMGMTLLIVAALFLVRLVALTILVMFSPIGFVGYAVPSFSKYAGQWWDNLFSYSFFAPIMIFVVRVALSITEATGKGANFQSFMSNANANASADQAGFIAQAAFFAVPIILLWVGMGIAKKSGIALAGEVTGKVQSWGTAGAKWATYGNPVARGIKEGVKDKEIYGKSINKGIKWWKSPSSIEAAIKGGITGLGTSKGALTGMSDGWKKAGVKEKLEEFNKKVNESKDDHTGMHIDDLRAKLNATATEKEAVTQAAMYRHFLSDPSRKEEMKNAIAGDSAYAARLAPLNQRAKDKEINKIMNEEMAKFRKNNADAQSLYTTKKPAPPRATTPATPVP